MSLEKREEALLQASPPKSDQSNDDMAKNSQKGE